MQTHRYGGKGGQLEVDCLLSSVMAAPACNMCNNNFIISKLVKKRLSRYMDDELLKNPG